MTPQPDAVTVENMREDVLHYWYSKEEMNAARARAGGKDFLHGAIGPDAISIAVDLGSGKFFAYHTESASPAPKTEDTHYFGAFKKSQMLRLRKGGVSHCNNPLNHLRIHPELQSSRDAIGCPLSVHEISYPQAMRLVEVLGPKDAIVAEFRLNDRMTKVPPSRALELLMKEATSAQPTPVDFRLNTNIGFDVMLDLRS